MSVLCFFFNNKWIIIIHWKYISKLKPKINNDNYYKYQCSHITIIDWFGFDTKRLKTGNVLWLCVCVCKLECEWINLDHFRWFRWKPRKILNWIELNGKNFVADIHRCYVCFFGYITIFILFIVCVCTKVAMLQTKIEKIESNSNNLAHHQFLF